MKTKYFDYFGYLEGFDPDHFDYLKRIRSTEFSKAIRPL